MKALGLQTGFHMLHVAGTNRIDAVGKLVGSMKQRRFFRSLAAAVP
jgi:hypothetical protein